MTRIRELMVLAIQGVFRARLRSGLTALGVAIASGSLVCMVGFVLGLQTQLETPARQLGLFNNIEVYVDEEDAGEGQHAGGEDDEGSTSPPTDALVLDDAAIESFESMEGVEYAYPDMRLSQVSVIHGDSSATTYAIGLPREATLIGFFGHLISAGQFFALTTEPEAVIGEQLAEDLGFASAEEAIGATIRLESTGLEPTPDDQFALQQRSQTVTITGVYRPPSFATSFGGKVVLLPLDVIRLLPGSRIERSLQRLRSGDGTALRGYSQVIVRAKRFADVPAVQAAIGGLGFQTRALADRMEEAKAFFVFMEVLLTAVGTVALVVAGLGILNTLLMSVLQRIKEIGIYKAVGASDGDVRILFLTEAGLLGLLGGVGGLILAWLVSRLIQWGVQQYALRQGVEGPVDVFHFPLWLLLGSIAYAILVSVVSGLYPASRAAKVDPMAALRYE